MDSSVFQDLKFLPDPIYMLQPNGHYLPFDQALSKQSTERDRPSLQKTKNKKSLSFSPSKQMLVWLSSVMSVISGG